MSLTELYCILHFSSFNDFYQDFLDHATLVLLAWSTLVNATQCLLKPVLFRTGLAGSHERRSPYISLNEMVQLIHLIPGNRVPKLQG